MKLLKFATTITLSVVVTLTSSLTVKADTTNVRQNNKSLLENSDLIKFSSNPKIKKIIDRINKEATSVSMSEAYVKISRDFDGKTTQQSFTESEYLQEILKENNSRKRRDLPITQDFGWIKLKLEAYKFGRKDFMASGSYTWLKVPVFGFKDTVAIGHDSTSTFNTQDSSGVFFTPYSDFTGSRKDVQEYTPYDSKNFLSSLQGVAYKFQLIEAGDLTQSPSNPYGVITVTGSITNDNGSNLQFTYGHAQLSLDYKLQDAVNFLATGKPAFKIVGSSDSVTIGDRVLVN